MPRATLNNGETGLSFRGKLNDNFVELYGTYRLGNETTTNPGPSNDNTQGYAVGSQWLNTATATTFRCFNAATGAAVWVAMGVIDHPGYVSGRFYPAQRGTVSATAVAANTLYAIPLYVATAVTISALLARVTTLSAGNARLGIYSNGNGAPSALLVQGAAAVSTGSVAVVSAALSASYLLTPGFYWMASLFDATPTMASIAASDQFNVSLIGSTTSADVLSSGAIGVSGVSAASTYASGLPATFPAPTLRSNLATPLMAFQVA